MEIYSFPSAEGSPVYFMVNYETQPKREKLLLIGECSYVRVWRHRRAIVVRTVNPNMKLGSSKTRRTERISESCLVK